MHSVTIKLVYLSGRSAAKGEERFSGMLAVTQDLVKAPSKNIVLCREKKQKRQKQEQIKRKCKKLRNYLQFYIK